MVTYSAGYLGVTRMINDGDGDLSYYVVLLRSFHYLVFGTEMSPFWSHSNKVWKSMKTVASHLSDRFIPH